ncbi:MAG: CBS domain-containing protein [Candidatus Aenigmarchaeota archaeon]|nr:CBS domain-containing protein [Candidatus Aenigmarchaeota archaeon]
MIRLEDIGINKSDNIKHLANLTPSYSFEFDSLTSVVKTIISSEHRTIPIVSKSQEIVGIISYMDILNALLRGVSRNIRISDFMTRDMVLTEDTDSIGQALQKIKISRRDCLPVVKNKKLLGMVTEHDFVKLLTSKYFGIPVVEVMSHKPFYITPNTSIKNCIKTMVNTHYRRLPIVNDRMVIGIVTGHDVLRYLNEVNYNTSLLDENVESIMTSPIMYINEHDDVSNAIKLMNDNKIGGIPVIDEGSRLKGIITERDIIELL